MPGCTRTRSLCYVRSSQRVDEDTWEITSRGMCKLKRIQDFVPHLSRVIPFLCTRGLFMDSVSQQHERVCYGDVIGVPKLLSISTPTRYKYHKVIEGIKNR